MGANQNHTWDVIERPEMLECGSNILTGADADSIVRCVELVLGQKESWITPAEYLVENFTDTVIKIVYGYFWQ